MCATQRRRFVSRATGSDEGVADRGADSNDRCGKSPHTARPPHIRHRMAVWDRQAALPSSAPEAASTRSRHHRTGEDQAPW